MELRIVTDERPKSGRPMYERTYGRVMDVLKPIFNKKLIRR